MASYGIVTTECFENGDLVIQKEECGTQLQSYIDKYESIYLYKLLGIERADELVDNLDNGVPQDPEILEWFNPFNIQGQCDRKVYISEGVKKMLSSSILLGRVLSLSCQ